MSVTYDGSSTQSLGQTEAAAVDPYPPAEAEAPALTEPPALPPASVPPRVIPADPGRSRAGNAMERTRQSILKGAREAFARHGFKRATMADVCKSAGIAKATLYNHVRTKPDLFRMMASSDIRSTLKEAAEEPSQARALSLMAQAIGEHPLIVRARLDDPTALNAMLNPTGPGAEQWEEFKVGVQQLLTGQPPSVQDAAVRWIVGHALWPATANPLAAAERLLGR